MMLNAYKRFQQLIDDSKYVESLYQYANEKIVVALDISDLLRWQWVQCVSAFDKLIHDLVKIGMLEIFNGTRDSTPKYNTFPINLNTHQEMENNPGSAIIILEQKIILCNSYKAFQEPSKVADALSYIWNENDKWLTIAAQMGIDKNTCCTTLKNIVIRRNQIVHEGDYTDILSKRQEIFEQDVLDVRNFILKLGESVYNCVK